MTHTLITVAPTGAESSKADVPALPVTLDELVTTAKECQELGAAVVHVHARDGETQPTLDPVRLRDTVQALRTETDLIVQLSTGGAVTDPESDRLAALDAEPDAASCSMGTVNFGRDVFMEKLLEGAGIKLSSVASEITGVSGRAMLEALIDGQRDPAVLADLAKRRLRAKIPALTEALTGRFSDHHGFLARLHLDLIDGHTQAIGEVTERIEAVIEPFRAFRELIATIPGINTGVADVICAETGADMTRFPTTGHLASWAGTCPGSNESAARIKSTKTRPGNPYLKGALGAAAMSAARTSNTYLGVKYRRIAARRGPMKALVAVEHAMLVAIWNMTTTGTLYHDPGPDFYTRLHPDRAKHRALDQLRTMGYEVTLSPLEAAAG